MDTKESVEQIYRRHFKRLYEMAYRALLDKDDALDCVHAFPMAYIIIMSGMRCAEVTLCQ